MLILSLLFFRFIGHFTKIQTSFSFIDSNSSIIAYCQSYLSREFIAFLQDIGSLFNLAIITNISSSSFKPISYSLYSTNILLNSIYILNVRLKIFKTTIVYDFRCSRNSSIYCEISLFFFHSFWLYFLLNFYRFIFIFIVFLYFIYFSLF